VDDERARRRALGALSLGQVLGGVGIGASLSIGALAAAQVSGSEALSGLAQTLLTLGAAAAAIPLARLAVRSGRRPALAAGTAIATAGAVCAFVAIVVGSFPLLLAAMAMLGGGQAVNLQSRFAATDLSRDRTRGRDLSLVVWSTTIGAVLGPNLGAPGQGISEALGLPDLAGVYLFPIAAQALACVVYLVLLRPDPLLLARARAAERAAGPAAPAAAPRPEAPATVWRFAIVAIALTQASMVALMSMTPVHLQHHGASLTVIGLTISLHVAGMYALSPVFGLLTDRLGPLPVVLGAQAILAASGLLAAFTPPAGGWAAVALVLLGLGWSAGTVAGSALLVAAAPAHRRVQLQGRSDLVMNLSGAGAGALAGPVLAAIGYEGLGLVLLAPAAVVFAGALLWGRAGGGSRPSPDRAARAA